MATTANRRGGRASWTSSIALHAAEVFRYVYAVLGNRADAEDVTQTTFVNALRALERGEQPRKPTNWLITIAHNLIRQRFRQQQRGRVEVELDRDVPATEDDDDGPSIDDLVRALQRIPPTQREALVLRELEGARTRRSARCSSVSQSALEALIFRLAAHWPRSSRTSSPATAPSWRSRARPTAASGGRSAGAWSPIWTSARAAPGSPRAGSSAARAFKALAVLPLPFSLTFFKGAPSA